MKKVSEFEYESDSETKLDLLVLLEVDVTFVETVRSESLKQFENNESELSASQARIKELKDVQFALKSYQSMVATLEIEKEELKTILDKEHKIIKSWMNVPKPYANVKNNLENQKLAYESGDLHLASMISDLDKLPSELNLK